MTQKESIRNIGLEKYNNWNRKFTKWVQQQIWAGRREIQ